MAQDTDSNCKDTLHESQPDSTFLFQDVSIQLVNTTERGSAWVQVASAERLFESFRNNDKFQPTARVSIEGDHAFKILDADFESNKVLLDTSESRGVRLSDGAIIVHLGDVPMWRMLDGKGGYDLRHDALYLTHLQSRVMLELGYGSLRVRAREDGEVLFVAYDGEVHTDQGVFWARFPRTQGVEEYEPSWFAPLVAKELETVDNLNPLGRGKAVTVEQLRGGCWMGAVTNKGMIVFKNFNCNYTMHGESTEYPISVFLNPAGMILFISSADACLLVANREVKTMSKPEALTLLRKFLSLKPLVPYRAKAASKHRRSSVSDISDGSFSRSTSQEDAVSKASSASRRASVSEGIARPMSGGPGPTALHPTPELPI